MIRARLTVDTDSLKFDEFYERQVLIVDDVTRSLVSDFAPAILGELQSIPRKRNYPSDYPLEWTSDKQRKAYFATNGFGKGIPYKRTGDLARGWRVVANNNGAVFAIAITNPSKSAKFVYGSLARNVQEAKRYQQRFHAITGWLTASETANYWLDEMSKEFLIRYSKAIGDLSSDLLPKKRAYTR